MEKPQSENSSSDTDNNPDAIRTAESPDERAKRKALRDKKKADIKAKADAEKAA